MNKTSSYVLWGHMQVYIMMRSQFI